MIVHRLCFVPMDHGATAPMLDAFEQEDGGRTHVVLESVNTGTGERTPVVKIEKGNAVTLAKAILYDELAAMRTALDEMAEAYTAARRRAGRLERADRARRRKNMERAAKRSRARG